MNFEKQVDEERFEYFVLINLKIRKITHQDLGQMDTHY